MGGSPSSCLADSRLPLCPLSSERRWARVQTAAPGERGESAVYPSRCAVPLGHSELAHATRSHIHNSSAQLSGPSVGPLLASFVGRSVARSVARCVGRAVGRSFTRSVARPDFLVNRVYAIFAGTFLLARLSNESCRSMIARDSTGAMRPPARPREHNAHLENEERLLRGA